MRKYDVYDEIEEEVDQDEEWWLDEEEDQEPDEESRATFRSAWAEYCSREDN